jgi:hypothetical protein
MVYFQTKNPNMGNFCKVLQWKMLVYFMAIWSISQLFGIFAAIYYVLWSFGNVLARFGMLCQEKSGNPAWLQHLCKVFFTKKNTFSLRKVSYIQQHPTQFTIDPNLVA